MWYDNVEIIMLYDTSKKIIRLRRSIEIEKCDYIKYKWINM